MRAVYTLIFAGFISFTGFTAYAQPGVSLEAMIQSLTTGGSASGISISDVVQGITGQLMDTSTPVEQQTSAIEGPLVVDVAVPEVNQTVIEATDARTGRYTPKLKIDFAEFPLRSLTEVNRPNNGRYVHADTPAEMIAQRVQSRICVPEFQLAVEDRTAIISGTVATERERKLIESMLRFEPGINTIKNEITVAP